MILIVLIVFGVCLGSFVNALVWRIYKQENSRSKKAKAQYSISTGRSMCTHCKHLLAVNDLVPVFSWLALRGKCRYCHKPIQDNPTAELLLPALFVLSYYFWPNPLGGDQIMLYLTWLLFLVGFLALAIYDLRWYLLPNRILTPLAGIFALQLIVQMVFYGAELKYIITVFLGAVVGGGFFWVLFQVSQGKWIGGGDVKLGLLIGAIVGGPLEASLLLFVASLLGTVATLPLLLTGRANRTSKLPFGPFLLLATVLVRLFGEGLIGWYKIHAGL